MTSKFHRQSLRNIRFAAIAVSGVFVLCVAVCVLFYGKAIPWHDHVGAANITVVSDTARRVVSLAPSLTEILFALGLNSRDGEGEETHTAAAPLLVGRTRYCTHPAQALAVPEIGGLGDPSIERLLALRPDLILATPMTPPEVLEQLRTAGFNTLVLKHEGVQGVLSDIQTIGNSVGKATQAGELVAKLRARLDKLRVLLYPADAAGSQAQAARARPKVLFLYDPEGLYSAGPNSFASELIAAAGGENLADKATSAWPQLSMEFILAGKPDLILVSGADNGADPVAGAKERAALKAELIAKWRADPRWRELEAVRHGRVAVVAAAPFTVPGPRMVDGAEDVSQALLSITQHQRQSSPDPQSASASVFSSPQSPTNTNSESPASDPSHK